MYQMRGFIKQNIHRFKTAAKKYREFLIGLFYLVVVAIVMWPQFLQKNPALIDDGTDLLQVRQLSYGQLFQIDLLEQQRTWPLRLQVRKVMYDLFGSKIGLHFLVWAGILWSVIWLFRQVCKKNAVPDIVAVTVPLLLLAEPSIYGNFYRLGTAEPLQTALLFLGIFFLMSEKITIATVFFVANLFVKETSIFYLLPFLTYLLISKKKWHFVVSLLFFLEFAALLVFKHEFVSGYYTARTYFSMEYLARAMHWQTWTFGLLLIVTTLLFFSNHFNVKRFFLLFLYLSTFAPFFIWNMGIQEYYQLPNHSIGMVIVIILLADFLRDEFKKQHLLLLLFIFMFYGYYLTKVLIPNTLLTIKYWQREYEIGGNLVGYLLITDLSEKSVYNAVRDFERHDKILLFVNGWRNNKAYIVPSGDKWTAAQSDDFIRQQLVDEAISEFSKSTTQDKILITDQPIFDLESTTERVAFCGDFMSNFQSCWYYVYLPKSK